MNDLSILHLSDLHIDKSGTSYSRLLGKLLIDIGREICYTKERSIIVVVTGDIIHQGPKYRNEPQAVNNALHFFEDLHTILGNRVAGIYIVPGNHDKYRTDENSFLIPAYRSMNDQEQDENKSRYDEKFYNSFWKYHLESYCEEDGSGYLELTKKIYKIYGMSEEGLSNKTFLEDTFGVDVIEVNKKRYCFILLNTAWSCIDNKDSRNIILGKFQVDKIKRQFLELMGDYNENERPAITIVLGHHPTSAFYGKEEDRIFKEMISFDSLDANVYLCGHTHDRSVNNWINNRHSLNTFVTGIGWPENAGGMHVGEHTYSIYVFNLNANSIDVYVRSTDDGGNFTPDFRIYTNKQDVDSKKLVFPIRAHETQTYIPLSVGENRSPKAYYISTEFLEYIRIFEKRMERVRSVIAQMMEMDKNELFENVLIEDEDGGTDEMLFNYLFANVPNEIDEVLDGITDLLHRKENENLLFEMFLGYLQKMCQKMQEILVAEECEQTEIVRFHFRFLADKNSFQYLPLCTSFPKHIDSSEYDVSEIKYGQLIEKSYEEGHSLIFSTNEEYATNGLNPRWTNFITVVPLLEKNNYCRKYASTSKKFPYLTFGVTINSEKFDRLLYCMDYFSIKETLEDVLDQYLQIFNINVGKFCSWAKDYLEIGGDANGPKC